MKLQLMLKYSISTILILLVCTTTLAQNETTASDSIKYAQKYGLRLGGDLSKLVRTFIDDDYSGFEINGDYRLTKDLYIAGEIGFEENTTATDYLNSTANGSYFKGGIDYNMYQNWFGMENMIYAGFRVGASAFKQTVNSYTIYNTNQSWPPTTINSGQEFSGLNAVWGELLIGIKAEVLSNIFVGINAQLKGRITEKEPTNFENIFIPGFGRTYDSGSFGIGFGYNISYLIPLYKKE
ncbi:MAG: hypothetical protein DA407_08500 [Bacteroidetes bacterium]|nr:MAG: hypothetical protein DA407_08500 [Bacteroidota bacterium]